MTVVRPSSRSEFKAEAVACMVGLQAVLIFTTTALYMTSEFSLNTRLKPVCCPTRQSDLTGRTMRTLLSTVSIHNAVNIQWIPAHVGLEGNVIADQEANCGSIVISAATSLPVKHF